MSELNKREELAIRCYEVLIASTIRADMKVGQFKEAMQAVPLLATQQADAILAELAKDPK